MKQQSEPLLHPQEETAQRSTTCKILPFRKPVSRTFQHDDGLIRDSLAVEPADDSFAELTESPMKAAPAEPSDAISCHAWAWGVKDSSPTAHRRMPRWFKKALLLATFAAWTVAAVIISIALG